MPRRKGGRRDDVAQKITAVHSTRLGAWCGLAVVQQITRGLSKNIKEHYHAENCTAVHYRSVLEQQRTCWSYLVKENLPSPAIKHWLKAAMKGHTRTLTKAVGWQNQAPKGARSLDAEKIEAVTHS